jgi:hypothetical protein
MTELLRHEPTGLALLTPYTRGKVPVVFIHGLWANPASWHRMIAAFEADPAIKDRYQFWTFGYSTRDPISYSAHLLRRDLDKSRRKLDPDRSDAAFDRMVIVGHGRAVCSRRRWRSTPATISGEPSANGPSANSSARRKTSATASSSW